MTEPAELDQVEPLASEWEELARATAAPPWSYPGWTSAWLDAFGRGALRILTVRREGRLAGVLPLQARYGELRSPTNWHTPGFEPVAVDRAAADELARRALELRPRRLSLAFLPAGSTGADALRAAGHERGYRLSEQAVTHSPYLQLEGGWEQYLATLDRKFVSELRRRRRRLESDGELAMVEETGRERLPELLLEGYLLEASGWKSAAGTSIDSRPETRAFYDEIARWAAERDWLRLVFLRLDGRPIAFQFGLEHGERFYLLKSGYDPAYRRFGPGLQLRYEMLARAFAKGLSSFEFLGSAVPWKLEWTQTTRELIRIDAFAPTLPAAVQRLADRHLRPVVGKLKRRWSS